MEKVTSKKKMIIAGIIAALCLAVVAGFASMAINNADAEDSPVAPTVNQNGFQFTVDSIVPSTAKVSVSATSKQASNVPAGKTALANFEAVQTDDGVDPVTSITLSVGYENAAAVAGQAVTIYVQHGNGNTDELTGTFSNAGTVTFTEDKGLSIFSVVTSLNENTSDSSPKTGIYS